MTDIESALQHVARMRDQLAASTRFQGFAPAIVAVTGGLALVLAVYQTADGGPVADARLALMQWIGLAVISTALIGTEAVIRARRFHRAMADTMVTTTLRQFLPVGLAGAIVGIIILMRAPEQAWALPGVWQLLIAVGICASLANLPRQMAWAAGWYFLAGAASLFWMSATGSFSPWSMGLPFGIGQVLVALLLHLASKDRRHG
jgi:hypothetical protein